MESSGSMIIMLYKVYCRNYTNEKWTNDLMCSTKFKNSTKTFSFKHQVGSF